MAGRSEKKRSERERYLGFYYSLAAIIFMSGWIVRHVILPRGGVKIGVKTLLWRGTCIAIPYIYSLTFINSSLRLGLPFSSANDIFFLTTFVCSLSFFVDWAYYILLIIPLYGIYKIAKLIYEWVMTPEPELEHTSKRAEKLKRKFKTIRA